MRRSHYLLTTQVPARGTVCVQDVIPFQKSQPTSVAPRVRLPQSNPVRFPIW